MQNQTSGLLSRLEQFEFDDRPAKFAFADRLAKENGWSREFTRRVMREYVRFMYLAAVAGHPVTPSEAVDQVWHLHMIYTRSYWERLCGRELGIAIHHEPTTGGRAEGIKFVDWYERTKDSYRRVIGEGPPSDIWPEAKHRFEDVHIRIDRRTHWSIEKQVVRRGFAWSAAVLGTLAIAGCATALVQRSPSSGAGVAILGFMLCGGIAVVVVLAFVIARSGWGQSNSGSPSTRDRRDSTVGGCGSPMMMGGGPVQGDRTPGSQHDPGGASHPGQGPHHHSHQGESATEHGSCDSPGHGCDHAGCAASSDSGGSSDGGGAGCSSGSGCGSSGGCGSSS